MKVSELRGLSLDELRGKLEVEKENYSKLKFAHAITPIENPMRIKSARKLVARIQTEIRAKELSK
jgi:large subunit ribosomal protein L29